MKIDCGVGAFNESDSMVGIGSLIKTHITFNKVFEKKPVIVVSWKDLNVHTFCDYVYINNLNLDGQGFDAVTITKNNDTLKYDWQFYWIAIGE